MEESKVNVKNHIDICEKLTKMFELKNSKYGNSVERGFNKYGPVSLLVRLEDKLNRIEQLLLNNETGDDTDERITDTLEDLANYAIISTMILSKDYDK